VEIVALHGGRRLLETDVVEASETGAIYILKIISLVGRKLN
jgi:hypothetical protein